MSGIYIPGMKMPTSCCDCPMDKFRCLVGKQDVDLWKMAKERHPDCPLVPVPPHGRLIDADALNKYLKDMVSLSACNDRVQEAYIDARAELNTMPTIIPADKEGEG